VSSRLPRTRWLEPDSELSPELRQLLRTAATSPASDMARLRRVHASLLPLLGGMTLASDLQAHPPCGQIATNVAVNSAVSGAATTVVVKVAYALFLLLGLSVAITADNAHYSRRTVETAKPPPRVASAGPSYVSLEQSRPVHAPVAELPATDISPRVERLVAIASPPVAPTGASRSVPRKSQGLPGGAEVAGLADSIAEQARLLQAVKLKLASSPSTALTLLQEHARRFPGSPLGLERHLFTIEALAACGRRVEAERQREQRRMRMPQSPLLRRAEQVLRSSSNAEP